MASECVIVWLFCVRYRLDVAEFIPLVSGVKSLDIKSSRIFSITELLMFSFEFFSFRLVPSEFLF